jgi:hypothetical protein
LARASQEAQKAKKQARKGSIPMQKISKMQYTKDRSEHARFNILRLKFNLIYPVLTLLKVPDDAEADTGAPRR